MYKLINRKAVAGLSGLLASCLLQGPVVWGAPVDLVEPRIDTIHPRIDFFASAAVPFGMVALHPDTHENNALWDCGYRCIDPKILFFSHSHMVQTPGIPIMPITGPIGPDHSSRFSHDDEVAVPGYHKVKLIDSGITAEMTATCRVGLSRYTFPACDEAHVIFDNKAQLADVKMTDASAKQVSPTRIAGCSVLGTTSRRQTSSAAELHVAPGGNDTNPGTAAMPFATLERARDAARQMKGSTVILAPGTYRLKETLALDQRDSGTTYTGKDARISGAVAIPNSAVKPVTDPAVLERLLPEARGKILEVDLRALGISDFGAIGPRGFRRPYVPAPLELMVDDQPLNLSQWPKPGQPGIPIGKVLDKGSVPRNGEKPDRGGTFEFKTDRPERWPHATDVWIAGFFENGFADNTVQVKAFDLAKNTITTVQPHVYGFASGQPWNRWTALNLLEEISLPGEYMADKSSGKLYFLPPKNTDITRSRLEVSMLQAPLVAIEGGTSVIFNGVTFECSRGMGVYIERGANNRIQNCTLRNIGMVAVCIGTGISPNPTSRATANSALDREGGQGQGIVGCTIYNIGAGAIMLGGGDRKMLTPAGNFVENCTIHDFNRWEKTYKPAVNIEGVGNRISHCVIHDAPGQAILAHGNDHVIEYNEIYRVVLNGYDMGAYYTGRNPSERGTVIRYNYWHDLAFPKVTYCIYFDDSGGDDTTVFGNVFCNAGNKSTVFNVGGSDFKVTNNVFVDCKKPIEQLPYYPHPADITKGLAEVGYDKSPWSEHYPEFVGYLHGPHPRNNVFASNLVAKSDDPRFADGAHGNFALKPGANTGLPNFQPIPFDKIGLEHKP